MVFFRSPGILTAVWTGTVHMKIIWIGIILALSATTWAQSTPAPLSTPAGTTTDQAAAAATTDDVVTVAGRIRVGFDDQKQLKSLELVDDDGSEYRLMLTADHLPLADLHGQRVTIVGTLNIEADVQWLTVRSYQLMETP
jgi:hypothetical protein